MALNRLNYKGLVPDHGKIQTDTSYVDLNIEVANYVANTRDELIAKGIDKNAIPNHLDLESYKHRFIGNDRYLSIFYEGYFGKPLIAEAINELSGEPMVELIPKTVSN